MRIEEKGQNLHMTAGTTAAQEATYEANQNIEELRKSRELVESIGSQLSSTKAELVMKSKEISRLENEMHSLSSSLSEVGIHYTTCISIVMLLLLHQVTYIISYHKLSYS